MISQMLEECKNYILFFFNVAFQLTKQITPTGDYKLSQIFILPSRTANEN